LQGRETKTDRQRERERERETDREREVKDKRTGAMTCRNTVTPQQRARTLLLTGGMYGGVISFSTSSLKSMGLNHG
jgi:hypothetical protein